MVVFPTLSLLNCIQDELSNLPGISGIGGIRFLLFEGFLEEVAERFGTNQRQPSVLERNLLIIRCFTKLEAEGAMTYLNRMPFTANYRQAILQGIAEWKRSRLTPEIFGRWAIGGSDQERQLALLYQSYQNLLTQYGFDEADLTLAKLESKRKQLKILHPTPVLLYGFTDLTPLQNALIKTLAAWFDFEIILDPTKISAFRELSASYFNIAMAVEDGNKDNFREVAVGSDPSAGGNPQDGLTKLQDCFGTGEPENITLGSADDSLRLIQTAGLTRQATGIAREIAALLKLNPGIDPGDFLILTPEPQNFLRTAAPIFMEYRLPLVKAALPATEFAWVNQISNALTAVANDWQWPDLEVLIRQFYLNAAPACDRLLLMLGERYGALSGRERWLKLAGGDSFRQYFQENGFNLEPLFQGIDRLAAIPVRASVTNYLGHIQDLIAGILKTSAGSLPRLEEFSGEFPEAETGRLLNYRALQLLSRGCDEWSAFLAGMPELQPEIEVSEFQARFDDYLLTGSNIVVEPPASGQPGIRALPLREARGLKTRFVFITGLEQGVFPRMYINDWKVDARGRLELKKLGIELETGAHYLLQERLAFYWALQSAGERLYLVYQDQDAGGQPLNRSIFLDEVLAWVPELATRRQYYPLAPGLPETLAECYSASEIRRYWARRIGRAAAKFPETGLIQPKTLFESASYRQLTRFEVSNYAGWGPRRPFFIIPPPCNSLPKCTVSSMFLPSPPWRITGIVLIAFL